MDNDLYGLLATDIPSTPKHTDGFLDITWQGHKENIISRIYAYFLNPTKNEAIAGLFIDSLLELIDEECNKKFTFECYECYLEYGTINGNRIDLLIRSEDAKGAIIIENKIYHRLLNDLEDYWNTIIYPETNKVGILLTLNNINIPETVKGKFINITHSQWIERVKQKGIPQKLSTNEYVYLTDFIKNIERLTKSETMNEQAKFFFEHPIEVVKAIETYRQAEQFILSELTKTSAKIASDYNDSRWHLSGTANYKGYRYIWDGVTKAYYTIIFNDLLSNKKEINIIIELFETAIQKDQSLKDTLADNNYYKKLYQEGERTPNYVHFATNKYVVNMSELERLGDFVYETIKRDFKPVMDVILKTLNGSMADGSINDKGNP